MDFILIDGNSLINRAFYATPPLNTPDGRPTNAVYAFTNMLLKLQAELNPKYMLVAFDRKEPTFRHKMYTEYKAGRHAMPDELAVQIPLLKEVLDAMGVARYEKAGFEADDIIGTLAKKYDLQTAIFTGDRDSFQLVDDSTSVYFTKRGVTDTDIYSAENFVEKYGVTPCQVIDLKACMGDSSDNIKGIPGVGEKTALNLIQQYGSLEGVYEHIGELKGKLKEKVEVGRDSAYLSKTLATINTCMPIELTLEDMVVTPIEDKAKQKFLELGFVDILKKVGFAKSDKKEIPIVEINDIVEAKKKLASLNDLAFVLDGNVCFSDGNCEYKIVINQNFLDDGISFEEIPEILKVYFESDKNVILFDKKQVKRKLATMGVGFSVKADDLSILKYLVDFTGKISVEDTIMEYGESVEHKATGVYSIFTALKEKLISSDMQSLYYDLELPLSDVLYDMENEGIKVDVEVLKVLSEQYDKKLKDILDKVSVYTDENFNINSPIQLSHLLFVKLGLKGGKKLKNGSYSTKADVLEKLRNAHPVVEYILEYRKIAKLKGTYVDGLKDFVDKDHLVHTTYNQTLTSTGRLSSSEPNLQNIPVRSDEGKELRKMFISRFSDGVIVSSDYSQIELRLLADFSGCQKLVDAFKQGRDIHAITASQVFNVELDKVTSAQRRDAKAVNFGVIYGISGFGLAENLKISPKAGQEYIKKYFETYPEVKAYMDQNVDFARNHGYVKTMMNRKRYIKEINSSDFNLRSFGERAAMNMPLQGSSADIIKLAMIKVYNRIKKEGLQAKLILQIHDELVVDCPMEERDAVEQILKEEMETKLTNVYLECDVNSGKTWYEVK